MSRKPIISAAKRQLLAFRLSVIVIFGKASRPFSNKRRRYFIIGDVVRIRTSAIDIEIHGVCTNQFCKCNSCIS